MPRNILHQLRQREKSSQLDWPLELIRRSVRMTCRRTRISSRGGPCILSFMDGLRRWTCQWGPVRWERVQTQMTPVQMPLIILPLKQTNITSSIHEFTTIHNISISLTISQSWEFAAPSSRLHLRSKASTSWYKWAIPGLFASFATLCRAAHPPFTAFRYTDSFTSIVKRGYPDCSHKLHKNKRTTWLLNLLHLLDKQ